jgi:ClpP class serine protease
MDQAGYEIKVIRSAVSPDKNQAHPYEPISEKAVANLQAKADAAGERFVSDVSRGRGVSIESVAKDFGGGRMMTASDALKAGMIDAIGDLGDALRVVSSTTAPAKRPKYRSSRT